MLIRSNVDNLLLNWTLRSQQDNPYCMVHMENTSALLDSDHRRSFKPFEEECSKASFHPRQSSLAKRAAVLDHLEEPRSHVNCSGVVVLNNAFELPYRNAVLPFDHLLISRVSPGNIHGQADSGLTT